MKPIIPPKYDIGFIIKNANLQLIEALEPWCSTVYYDESEMRNFKYADYIEKEDTSFDLHEKFKSIDSQYTQGVNDIIVKIDGNQFGNNDFRIIQTLPEILANDDQLYEEIMIEPTHFQIENLQVTINSLQTYEMELICNEQ